MVMKSVDRGNYYSNRQQAYIDRPMEIGDGQTISAPHMHSLCLELLSDFVQPGSRVLDVGSEWISYSMFCTYGGVNRCFFSPLLFFKLYKRLYFIFSS
jgi:hypothetical protein